jgi:hypothetical protein
MYAARGLRVVRIRGDFEFNGIKGLVALLTTATKLDLSAENEHIGAIERNIRYCKEKVRSIRVGLCYERDPGIVIVYMVLGASRMLNLFPRSGGVPHYSPNVIMKDEGVTMKQFRLPFGTYVQVKESSTQTNSMLSRTRGAVSLGTMDNSTGGGLFMALDTGKVIRRSQWTVHPVTAEVKRRVEQLGNDQPSVMTWYNRQGEVIGDNGTLWDGAQVTDNSDHDDENDDIATSAQLPALLLNREGVNAETEFDESGEE